MKYSRGYISEIDQFLQDFDQKHPERSASQQKTQAIYQKIYYLRDTAERPRLNTHETIL